MFWTLELAGSLDDAPWPATKDELIDYANRTGAPQDVVENLQELEDDGEIYESIEDIWPTECRGTLSPQSELGYIAPNSLFLLFSGDARRE